MGHMPRLLVASVLVPAATAWWSSGHMVVAELAGRRLGAGVAAGVAADLATYAELYPLRSGLVPSAEWLDTVKHSTHAFHTWHYVDWPVLAPGLTADDEPPMDNADLLFGLRTAAHTLADATADAWSRSLALRTLIHLVGDMHQPMHTVTYVYEHGRTDWGGNGVHLEPAVVVSDDGSTARNLHAFWDGGCGGTLVSVSEQYPPPEGRLGVDLATVAAAADALAAPLVDEAAEQRFGTLDELVDTLELWAHETSDLARTSAYAGEVNASLMRDYHAPVNTTSAGWGAYAAASAPLADQQLRKAGGRLAATLTSLYALSGRDKSAPAPPAAGPEPPPCPQCAPCHGANAAGWQSAGFVGFLGAFSVLLAASTATLAVLYRRERSRRAREVGLQNVAFSVLSGDDEIF